jgi:integrase
MATARSSRSAALFDMQASIVEEAGERGPTFDAVVDGCRYRCEDQAVHEDRTVGCVRLLLFTGCRLREILHLRWEHVDIERGCLFLPDSKSGRRTVILNAPALAVLNRSEPMKLLVGATAWPLAVRAHQRLTHYLAAQLPPCRRRRCSHAPTR